jgi:predicted phage-related endonuclease
MGSKPVGISASRGAAVLGLSQFSTRVDVWAQIMEDRQPGFCAAHGITPPEPVSNAAVRWGTAFESSVIQLSEIARGMKIGDRELACAVVSGLDFGRDAPATNDDPPITCHLDGLYSDGVIHEGKTTSAFAYRDAWGEPGTDRIPRNYTIQTQHQLLAAKAERTVVSVLVFPTRADEWEEMGLRVTRHPPVGDGESGIANGFDYITDASGKLHGFPSAWATTLAQMGYFHQYPVAADPALQSMMLDAYRDFWTRYVLTETPPPAETYSDILLLMPEPRGTVVATEDQERWASDYNQIGKEAAQSKKQQDKLKALLLGAIERGAEHPIDNDSVEAIVLRDRTGKKIASYSKGKEGRLTFRCGG